MPAMQTEATPRPAAGLDLPAMQRLIRNARWLLRSSWGATGLGLTAGLFLAVLVAAVVLDLVLPAVLANAVPVGYLVPLTVAFRVTAAVLIVVPAVYVFAVGVVIPTARRLRASDVARRIEGQIPGMHNRLVACMDLAAGGSAHASPAFYRRLTNEAAEKLRGYRSTRVVDFPSLGKALGFAAVALAAFGVLWLGFRDRLPVALARLATPTADVPPASGVEFTATPAADARLLRGDDVTFAAKVTRGGPQALTVQLYSESEREPVFGGWVPVWMNPTWPKTRTITLDADKADPDSLAHTLTSSNLGAGFDKSFSFRVFGGGTWTRLRAVTLLERPEVKGVRTALHYPTYLKITESTPGKANAWDVAGPGGRANDAENGAVEVTVETAGSVATGEIQLLREAVVRTPVPAALRSERVWFRDEMPAGSAPAGGTWVAGQPKDGRTAHTDPAQPGPHFHAFQQDPKGLALQPDDVLFAWVFTEPKNRPEAVLLQWQDETGNWDHAAFWGAEKLTAAKFGLSAAVRAGSNPEPGGWRLLAVPARAVGLEGRTLKGMSFRLLGGQAAWAEAGAKSPDYTESIRQEVAATFPLTRTGDDQWSGRFPLRGDGLWRVELKNELGHANIEMKPGRHTATPDEPPQVAIAKPGSELVVSSPQKVPVVVEAFDALGLDSVRLRWKREEFGDFKSEKCPEKRYEPVRRYEDLKPADSVVLMLDLEALGLKVGDTVRYQAFAVDRLGQKAESKPYTIRIADDANAADKQLEAFEKAQDPFRDKLVKLIADQAKVNHEVEKLAAKYAELTEKIEAAKLEELKNAPKPAAPTDPAKAAELEKKLPKIDEKTAKELDDLRKELAKLLGDEQKNVALGDQMKADLNNLADQAAKNALVPPEVANELNALKEQFEKAALNPLKDLAGKFNEGANQKDTKPDLQGAKDESARVQQNLEALLNKMNAVKDAVADTRKGDAEGARDRFKDALEKAKNELTAAELEQLKAAIEALKGELERMKGAQDDLKGETEKATDADLPKVGNKQDNLDDAIKDALEKAKNALASEKKNKKKRDRPDAPYTPEEGDEKAPPREGDTDTPLPKDPADKKDAPKDGEKGPNKEDMPEEDDDTFDGVLGKKPKDDPRFKDPRKKPKTPREGSDADKQRADLKDRQEGNLSDLERAKQGLESDKSALQDLIDQIKSAAAKGSKEGKGKEGPEGKESDNPLADALKEAMAMSQRMKQGKGQGKGKPQNGPRTPSSNPNSDLNARNTPADIKDVLGKLDIDTRNVILQMQPKLREEVLQGMQGLPPEGYRRHVEDYFKRLTEVQKAAGMK